MTRLVHPSARHLLVMLLCSGCATARLEGHTTWEEDIEEGVVLTTTEGKSRHDPAQDLVDVEVDWAYLDRKEGRPKVVRIDPPPVEEVAAQLELSLLRFTSDMRMVGSRLRAHDRSRRRRAKKKKKKPRPWPKPLVILFSKLLDELDEGLAVAPDALMPKRVLLQARVTTEAEKEQTEMRFGPCPPNLAWRIQDLNLTVRRLLLRNIQADESERPASKYEHGAPRMQWPVSPQMFTSYFGYRRHPMTGLVKFHTGVDMGAPRGVLVNAAAAGKVVHAGWSGGYGRMVVVQHLGGFQTIYAHLAKIITPVGAPVDQGTPVGYVGSTGRSTGPHLHFEVRNGGRPVDPMKIVGLRVASRAGSDRSGDTR